MAKVTINTSNVVAAAFAPQTAEGTLDTTLDGITTTLSGDPNGTDQGLLLGDANEGLSKSGLTLAIERVLDEQSVYSGSFTRGLGSLLRPNVSRLQFAFPFCGPRRTTTTPVDNDFRPLRGVDALLQSAGLLSAAWGSGVGHSVAFSASALPCSALLYLWGNRYEMLDCRARSFEIAFAGGKVPKATVDLAVGSIKDPTTTPLSVASSPTLTYGAQATVAPPVANAVGFLWRGQNPSVGLQEITLSIQNQVSEFGDMNATYGVVQEIEDRTVEAQGLMYVEGASTAEVFEFEQILADAIGDLTALSFTVGTAAGASSPAKAVYVSIPSPEVIDVDYRNIGSKAAVQVTLRARASAANGELELRFI